MTVAAKPYSELLEIAADLGCVGIEVRTDLPGKLFDGMSPQSAGNAAWLKNLRVLALAEVKAFTDFTDQKLQDASLLAQIAVACSAEAICLIPRNDGIDISQARRRDNLQLALRELKPVLLEAGLSGFVEPLGFESASVRFKSEAVDAIDAVDGHGCFKLVHDTFHHHLAGETDFFPDQNRYRACVWCD